MLMGDLSESCSSRVVEYYTPITTKNRRQREKADIYHEVLRRLKDLDVEEVKYPGFEDDLWAHFNRLPLRYAVYALDMNIEKAEDVLMHKRLLQMARDPATRPAVEVRLVVQTSPNGTSGEPIPSNILRKMDDQLSGSKDRDGVHPPTAFKFPSHLEAAFERTNLHVQDTDGSSGSDYSSYSGPRHEITISTNDKPKFLSQLTSLMSGLGLNIREAHAFSTGDGYSLDVFVVDSWKDEGTEELRASLIKEIQIIEEFTSNYGDCIIYKAVSLMLLKKSQSIKHQISCKANEPELVVFRCGPKHGCTNNEGTDFWEIDTNVLRFEKKIASGSYGDLYRGTYRSQDVAVKVFRTENLNKTSQQEFAQEVYILRKIRHKNIVQFIGACARPPRLCIVTEYMPGGSVFDFLHKQQDVLKLATVLRWAIDVSNGMNYLHRNNIIHRDLKSANLLMDENYVVKIADFGVARVQTQPGVMTAETGTYRWMAPEVIEHKPYDHKADIFSFGILLWELVTGKLPYVELTPVQAAIGVVHKGLRPAIPSDTIPSLEKLLNRCWEHEPSLRPEFSEIVEILKNIAKTTQN